MHPRIVTARATGLYQLALAFADGTTGTVDLAAWIGGRGGVFAPLHDAGYFAQVAVDLDAGTVVWPNGVDLDPDMLYEAAHPTAARASA